MAQVFPIWITSQDELDLVYEGINVVKCHLHESSRLLQNEIIKLDNKLVYLYDEDRIESDEAKDISDQMKRKRWLIREMSYRIEKIHKMQKRLSDPSVPQEMTTEYYERAKKRTLASIEEKTI